MFLQGSFTECPLAELLKMLASKDATGRLDVKLESVTGQLYLMNGKPVDCCVGYVQGAAALDLLLSETKGTYRFSSGAVPPNLSFRKVEDLSLAEVASSAPAPLTSRNPEPLVVRVIQTPPPVSPAPTPYRTPTADKRTKGPTVVFVMAAIAGGVGLTIGSAIANMQHRPATTTQTLTSTTRPPVSRAAAQSQQTQLPQPPVVPNTGQTRLTGPDNNVAQPRPEVDSSEEVKEPRKTLSIPVVLRIEDGRVVEAYAANPQPGREAYEATAVRLARQRRFDIKSGTETVVLTITEQ